MRTPKIVKIIDVQPYRIVSVWSNNQIRLNDYSNDIAKWVTPGWGVYNQLAEPNVFIQVVVKDGMFTWLNVLEEIDMGMGVERFPVQFDRFTAYDEGKLVKVDKEIRLADMIIKARREEKLTQKEVAEKAGLSKQYMSRVERAEIQVQADTLIKIAEAMGRHVVLI